MNQKSRKNNWADIKLLIVAASLTAMLGLWNFFALQGIKEKIDITPSFGIQTVTVDQSPSKMINPTLIPADTKILMGGSAPQEKIIVQPGSAPAPVTQTRSS